MVAAIVVVAAILIGLQPGGRADEPTSPAKDRRRQGATAQLASTERPVTDLTRDGIRRLPPVFPASGAKDAGGARENQRTAHFKRVQAEERPVYDQRVAPAFWQDDPLVRQPSLLIASEAGETSGGKAATSPSVPRTADDGHVYENDLPAPKSSEPVSLHLNEVNVRQALEMLSRSHNINMLVAPGVTGSVTANLEGLDSDAALNAILKLCNLVAHRENGVIYIYANTEYPKIDFQVRTFLLDYVAGTDAMPVISSLLSTGGEVFATKVDHADNSKTREAITIVDMPRVIQRAADYIRQVDVPPLQVMIEAHILQVILNDECRHGINYNQIMQTIGSANIQLDVVGFADPDAKPGVFAHLGGRDIDLLLEFLKTTTDSKTLASPRVMVVNGQTAKIQVGEQIPYKVITTTETLAIEEVKFLDVGVVLEVTPRISRDGRVMMRVKPKVSDGKFRSDSSLPGEETREVESDVLIRDGEGLVIGGLIQERDIDTQTKVPFLGDLHYVGRLFQKRSRTKQRSEVVITLIPRIRYAEGFSERELMDAERSQTPLFHGPLEPVYRPWEAQLPDAVKNPATLPRIYPGNCRMCLSEPEACLEHGNAVGPEKPYHSFESLQPPESLQPSAPLQPSESLQPSAPMDVDRGASLTPLPVRAESTGFTTSPGFMASPGFPYTEDDYLSPPAVQIAP